MEQRPARDPISSGSPLRTNLMLQLALRVSADRSDPERPNRDVRVTMGVLEGGQFTPNLTFATGTPDLAYAVAKGELDLLAINPSAFLTMAYRGTGPFKEPLPVRAIA